jgi:hypothetical protein
MPKKGAQKAKHDYTHKEGEPGSYRYFYENQDNGNIVRATNAPEGHPHHDPSLGKPTWHPREPQIETNPEFFNPTTWQKVNRAVPPNAEWNEDYDEEVPSKWWAARWDSPEGAHHQLYAYYDRFMKGRNDLRLFTNNQHFDQLLPKVRKSYVEMMKSKYLADQAVGVMIALMDQAIIQGDSKKAALYGIKVAQAELKGSTLKFLKTRGDSTAPIAVIRLDLRMTKIMHNLLTAPGKQPTDYLFSVPVKHGDTEIFQKVGYNKVAKALGSLGVSSDQFRSYHASERYSFFFEQLLNKYLLDNPKQRLTAEVMGTLHKQAATLVSRWLGNTSGFGDNHRHHHYATAKRYIDPQVAKSIFVSALDSDRMIAKALRLRELTDGL